MSGIVEGVGFRIREIREERGLTQEEVTALAALHRAYIGQIEQGEKNICVRNLEKIGGALEGTIQDSLDTHPLMIPQRAAKIVAFGGRFGSLSDEAI